MGFDFFGGDHWTVDELKDLLKQLELAYASSTRTVSFKDQSVTYSSKGEISRSIKDLRKALMARGELGGSSEDKLTKRIKIQSKSKGF